MLWRTGEGKRETTDIRILLLYRHHKYVHPFALNTFFGCLDNNVCCVHGGGKAVRKRRFVVRATNI